MHVGRGTTWYTLRGVIGVHAMRNASFRETVGAAVAVFACTQANGVRGGSGSSRKGIPFALHEAVFT